MSENDDWPFADQKNVAVFTTTRITKQNAPILFVSHDEDDGSWQFLDGGEPSYDVASLVSLNRIFTLDHSVGELAELPYGWKAWRETKESPWQVFNTSGQDEEGN